MTEATAIEGNIYQDATRRLAVVVALMMGRKNAPMDFEACDQVAEMVRQSLSLRQLYLLVHGKPESEVEEQIRWSANNILDRVAARSMIRIFADIASIPEVPLEEEDRLVFLILYRLKADNPVGAADVIWPLPRDVEKRAITLLGPSRPLDITAVETSIAAALEAWWPSTCRQ